MRHVTSWTIVALLASASLLQAADIKSGLQKGKFIGAFNVTKCAGAEKDGVKVGANLCYRCKNGGRPQVVVFTRSSDKKVQELVTKLDKALDKNKSKELRVFVNMLGENKGAASKAAKKLAASTKAKNVPFVVPNEFENGPADYGINAKAEVTILLASGGQVKANFAAEKAKGLDVDQVVKGLSEILK